MVCCIGLPTIIIATAFSFGGTVLMRMFLGSSTQPSDEQQPSFASYPDKSVSREALPQQEIQPRRLRDFLSVGGLPIELQPSAAAFQRGELDIARPAFVRFLRQSPKHAYAWLWLSVMIDDRDRQLECIRRALALEPENETAKKMLVFLEKSPTN
jgi:tetratricopeptide (TPR) repeat protein